MLKEVLDTQNQVKSGYENLDDLRRLIKITGNNMNQHMSTVDLLRSDLTTMDMKGRDFEYCLNKGDFKYMHDNKQYKRMNKPSMPSKKSSSLHNLRKKQVEDAGIKVGENGSIARMMNDLKNKADNKPSKDAKAQIVNTLVGINGSMKEFSHNLEMKLNGIYNNRASKKYGMNHAQKQAYNKKLAFNKGDYDAVANNAQSFLNRMRKGL